MADVRPEFQYGALKRAIREVLPKEEKRRLDVAMMRMGVPFGERRRTISALGMFALGVRQGIRDARNG